MRYYYYTFHGSDISLSDLYGALCLYKSISMPLPPFHSQMSLKSGVVGQMIQHTEAIWHSLWFKSILL